MTAILEGLRKLTVKPEVAQGYLNRANTELSNSPAPPPDTLSTSHAQLVHIAELYPYLCGLIPYAGSFDPLSSERDLGQLLMELLARVAPFLDTVIGK
jgi:hypothetical protein